MRLPFRRLRRGIGHVLYVAGGGSPPLSPPIRKYGKWGLSPLDKVIVYRYNMRRAKLREAQDSGGSPNKYKKGKDWTTMIYSTEVQNMCPVAKGAYHGPAPIPEEGKWVQAKEIKDISGLTHGVGWCAPQQGACKLTLNVKDGVIEEALVETLGCSGMTHSAAMASEILIGKTLLEALNTDLVCDAINTAMRELFLQIVYGRTQTAFSEGGLPIGASLEDLGKGCLLYTSDAADDV